MRYCKGICTDGHRCKRRVSSDFCSIHDKSILCGICGCFRDISSRTRLSECSHVFCHDCLSKSILSSQWREGFSTEDKLHCPECQINLENDSWQKVTSLLVERNLLKRKIIYKTYLCYELYLKLKPRIDLDHEYTFHDLDVFHRYHDRIIGRSTNNLFNEEYVEKVYFEKINPGDWRRGNTRERKIYIFCLGDPEIKNLFWNLWKDLAEYVFHPSRVKFE